MVVFGDRIDCVDMPSFVDSLQLLVDAIQCNNYGIVVFKKPVILLRVLGFLAVHAFH